jgi:hypothetical protein
MNSGKTHSGDAKERDEALEQEGIEQRQRDALQQNRRLPDQNEEDVRRRQGGHDRPVENDHRPHPRSEAEPGNE